jgi:hypothetical protein
VDLSCFCFWIPAKSAFNQRCLRATGIKFGVSLRAARLMALIE